MHRLFGRDWGKGTVGETVDHLLCIGETWFPSKDISVSLNEIRMVSQWHIPSKENTVFDKYFGIVPSIV